VNFLGEEGERTFYSYLDGKGKEKKGGGIYIIFYLNRSQKRTWGSGGSLLLSALGENRRNRGA